MGRSVVGRHKMKNSILNAPAPRAIATFGRCMRTVQVVGKIYNAEEPPRLSVCISCLAGLLAAPPKYLTGEVGEKRWGKDGLSADITTLKP